MNSWRYITLAFCGTYFLGAYRAEPQVAAPLGNGTGIMESAVIATGISLERRTIDGGGVMRAGGGNLELSGTVGQVDAARIAEGDFELTGGFWFELVSWESCVNIGPAPPVDPSELTCLTVDTRSPYTREYLGSEGAKQAHCMLRWANTRGETGPPVLDVPPRAKTAVAKRRVWAAGQESGVRRRWQRFERSVIVGGAHPTEL
jgi:hypothetical protein